MEYSHEIIVPNDDLPFKMFIFEGSRGGYIRQKHWHRSIEIFAVFDGEMEFYLNDKRYPLHPGEFMLVNSTISLPLLKPTTVYVLTISIYAGLAMFNESYMLWKGNNSPQNIGLTIVGYLYRQGIEKRAMGYACAVGLVLLIIVMVVNMIQLAATGTFKKEER